MEQLIYLILFQTKHGTKHRSMLLFQCSFKILSKNSLIPGVSLLIYPYFPLFTLFTYYLPLLGVRMELSSENFFVLDFKGSKRKWRRNFLYFFASFHWKDKKPLLDETIKIGKFFVFSKMKKLLLTWTPIKANKG